MPACSDPGYSISPCPGQRVAGPDDAVMAVGWAVDVGRTATVFLLLDAGRHVTDVRVLGGLLATENLDRAIEVLRGRRESSIVVAAVSPGRPTLPSADEREAWRRLRWRCADGGVRVLDCLIISGHRWRSLAETES